jgi:hypothetical protein
LVAGGEASRLRIVSASIGFWEVTSAQAMLGTLPTDAEAQGMWSVAGGLVVGLLGAWTSTRSIAGLLYGVQPHDPATFAVTTLVLGSIACLACVVPALKAALIDPATALRAE